MGSTRQALGSSKSHSAADATRIAAIAADSTVASLPATAHARLATNDITHLTTRAAAIIRAVAARTVRILLSCMPLLHRQASRPGPLPGRFIVASSP